MTEPSSPERTAGVKAPRTDLKARVSDLADRVPDLPGSPFSPRRWRSPIRGPWLTSVFGSILLVGIPVEFVTGLLSYASYDPRLGHNNPTGHVGFLDFYLFTWPSAPQWLFRVTEGIHVGLGLALTPVLLAKLWSVIPKLFAWPPAATVSKAVERLSLV